MFLESFENKFQTTLNMEEQEVSQASFKDLLEDIEMLKYVIYKVPDKFTEEQLIELLKSKNTYIRIKACALLTDIYLTKEHREEYIVFYRYYLRDTESYDELNQLYVLFARFLACKSRENVDDKKRKLSVCQDKCIIDTMVNYSHLKEVQYNILVVVYILSFDNKHIEHIVPFLDTIIRCLEERSREKIMRICYMIVVNILKSNYKLLIGKVCTLKVITSNLKDLNLNDIDLKQNIMEAYGLLNAKINVYDAKAYLDDLYNGVLEEGEFHYDPLFWSNGLCVILKNKVEVIKVLKKYLKSHKNTWIALACNDIYMLVKADPTINGILNKYKVRDVLFELTKNEDDEVRFKAVQALYMCIFSEWT